MPDFIPLDVPMEVVHYSGESTKKKNILFLGDGFSYSDEGFFDLAVRRIKEEIFRQAPFNLKWSNDMIENYFNVFKVFTPSNESGIDVERYIEKKSKKPSKDRDATDGTPNYVHIQRDSALGFRYKVVKEEVEIRLKPGFETMIESLLEQLNHPKEPTGNRTAIPYCWLNPEQDSFLNPDLSDPPYLDILGKDYGLVCVLINDDYSYGATEKFTEPYENQGYEQTQYVIVTLSNRYKFTKIINTGNMLIPDQVYHIPNCPSRMWFKITASTVLHELGHSHFGLVDEYVKGPDESSWDDEEKVEHYNEAIEIDRRKKIIDDNTINVECFNENIDGATNNIDPAQIRWNKILYDGTTQKIIHEDIIEEIKTNGPLFEYIMVQMSGIWTIAGSGVDKPSSSLIKKLNDNHPNKINFVRRIIGLYEGAYRCYKRVYRPAGICKMRYPDVDWKKKKVANEFCFVCMHWIVSKLIEDINNFDDIVVDPVTILKKLAEEKDPMWKCRSGV